jgi:lysozyme
MAPVLQTSERRLNAIADFIFNLGAGRFQTSTLRRCINAQDWTGAVEQLNKWIRGGGKVLPGLVARRAAESQLIR